MSKVLAEASGIFNHMLRGLIDLKTNGLVESDNIRAATEKYRDQSDQLGRFLHDCTRDEDGAREKSSTLFELFKAWVAATGGGEWQPQGFAKAMEDRGYERKTSNGVWWLDIAATATLEDVQAGKFGDGSGGGEGDDFASRIPDDDPGYNPLDD